MANALIALRGIGRDYGNDRPALSGVDLDIGPGESIAIVGRSGSGKSTLLNILGLLDRADQGTYEFFGEDISRLSEAKWCASRAYHFGFVFQAFHLIDHRSVAENVTLGALYQGWSRRRCDQRAAELIERFGLGHRASALPSTLSGGERQRVAIARALMGDPQVVLCDEPTGNLDSENADVVMSVLESLNAQGITTIVVTHDIDVAARAGRRVQLVDGWIAQPRLVSR